MDISPSILFKWNRFRSLILNNVKSLNQLVILNSYGTPFPENYESFIFEIYKNNANTLKLIQEPKSLIFEIHFPKLQEFILKIDHHKDANFFENLVEKLVDNTTVRHITLHSLTGHKNIIEKIKTKYANHCMWIGTWHLMKILPTKIGNCKILDQSHPYLHKLEYLNILVSTKDDKINENGWKEYKIFFSLCTNLKQIRLSNIKKKVWTEEQILECKIPDVNSKFQQIWKNRVLYLKSIGIKIASHKIMKVSALSETIGKESNLKWWFIFLD